MDNEKEFDNEIFEEDMDNIVKLKDEETGEEFEFAYIDNFEYNDKHYCVLLTVDEEEPEMIIFEENEDENGEITISSLEEEDEDAVYDYYDSLCDEYLDDEDESEE
ncbi:MAG: DUF1292 domain-containing protein [Clostridiales bacterium]|nr:DUF1292 domain-containing protein [Clostridiales bacterium]